MKNREKTTTPDNCFGEEKKRKKGEENAQRKENAKGGRRN